LKIVGNFAGKLLKERSKFVVLSNKHAQRQLHIKAFETVFHGMIEILAKYLHNSPALYGWKISNSKAFCHGNSC
jgi:hypothetical protein